LKVLLVQVDGFYPNLALMKIGAWHKLLGDEVQLMRLTRTWRKFYGKPLDMLINPKTVSVDKAYVSCIFTWNRSHATSVAAMFRSLVRGKVELGGSGIGLLNALPHEIEHTMPDYSLYDIHYSIGYSSRGCIRNCPWCIIPQKEGTIRENADLNEFLHPKHQKLMLLDNNLLAAPNWEKVLTQIIAKRLKVCFTQGLDIRLIDNGNANYLRLCKYYDDDWRHRRLYFAFDLPSLEDDVVEGIETLRSKGISPNRLMFYMLTGFDIRAEDYTWEYFLENDYHRFEVLRKLGTLPYVMVWNNRRDIALLRAFRRWVNRHLYNSWTFEQYLKHESKGLMLELKAKVKGLS